MSLFENDRYRWRETFFLMFRHENRPTVGAMRQVLGTLGSVEIREVRGEDSEEFESLSILAHEDNAAMDIVYSTGEDVLEQREEMLKELKASAEPDDAAKLEIIENADARLEVFHFEETIWDPEMDEIDEMLDPGTVLSVLELLGDFCDGVAVDPQSGTFI